MYVDEHGQNDARKGTGRRKGVCLFVNLEAKMPISPDFKWQESESWVKIDVVLRNVNALTADITSKLCLRLFRGWFRVS